MTPSTFCIRIASALLLLTWLMSTCSKFPKRGQSINKGAIVDNFTGTACGIKTYTNDACIIRSTGDFETGNDPACASSALAFDFKRFSIIGKTISGTCELKIIREVQIDHDKKQYTYTIRFKDKGICMKKAVNDNLVVVPCIPNDYTVLFNAVEE
jgi:hypothetical protein